MASLFIRWVGALGCALAAVASQGAAQSHGSGLSIRQGDRVLPITQVDPTAMIPIQQVQIAPGPFVIEVRRRQCPRDEMLVSFRIVPPPASNIIGPIREVFVQGGTMIALPYLFPQASGYAEYPGPVRQFLVTPAHREDWGWGFHYLRGDRFAGRLEEVEQIAVDQVMLDGTDWLFKAEPFVMMIGTRECEPFEGMFPFDLIEVSFRTE